MSGAIGATGLGQLLDSSSYSAVAAGASLSSAAVSSAGSQSSPGSNNSLHSLSPPVSPYDAGPPPTYQQHLNMVNRKRMLPTDNANSIPDMQVSASSDYAVPWNSFHHLIPVLLY